MRLLSAVSICMFLHLTPAIACDEQVSIDPAQARELLTIVADPAANQLDQFFAFDTLLCSDQSGLRDLALRTGAQSNNPTVRGQVLVRSMFEKETIGIEFLPVEGLSKDQYDYIRKSPLLTLPIVYRDLAHSCLSFHNPKECDAKSNMTMTGTLVVIHIDRHEQKLVASFRLDQDLLTGTVQTQNLVLPAQIHIY